jgi:hypothetical protein
MRLAHTSPKSLRVVWPLRDAELVGVEIFNMAEMQIASARPLPAP